MLKFRVFLVLVVGFFSFHCKFFSQLTKSSPDDTAGAVVTFVHGSVTLVAQGREISPQIGDIVRPGDKITTKFGTVDIQTYAGEVIRIKDNSSVNFPSLSGESNEETKIAVLVGNLLVKSPKLKSSQSLTVQSPTMVAGVRGTVFSFELAKDGIPQVKVYEGSVAVQYQTTDLAQAKGEGINEESFQKLVKTLESTEVILEPGEELKVSPKLHELVYLIQTRKSVKDLSEEEWKGFLETQDSVSKSPFTISPQAKAEAETLVQVGDENIQKNLSSTEPLGETSREALEKEHESKQKEAFQKIAENAKKMGLDEESEIQSHYSILEQIHKSNGEVLSGAVVAQMGETLIVHTTKGVYQLAMGEVEYVEYKNFKVQTKKK